LYDSSNYINNKNNESINYLKQYGKKVRDIGIDMFTKKIMNWGFDEITDLLNQQYPRPAIHNPQPQPRIGEGLIGNNGVPFRIPGPPADLYRMQLDDFNVD